VRAIRAAALLSVAIFVATGSSQLMAASAAPEGATLFRQRCAACHTDIAGQPAKVGPNLSGVVGRKAATTTFAYSPALKASGLVWDRANLDRYLAAPAKAVPGTKMVIAVSNKAERDAIVTYLAKKR